MKLTGMLLALSLLLASCSTSTTSLEATRAGDVTPSPAITAALPPAPSSIATLVVAATPAPAKPNPTLPPTPAAPAAAKPTVAPPRPTAAPTVSVSRVSTITLATELFAGVSGSRPTPAAGSLKAPPAGPGFEGVEVLSVGNGQDSQPLWVAFTYGMPDFTLNQSHFLAVYRFSDGRWVRLARTDLKEVDYVNRASVSRVRVEPSNVWFTLEGGVGAHGGAFYLLRFDGKELRTEVSHGNAKPGTGSLADLNGDGILEAILDASDYYVFAYATGVSLYNAVVMRWDGTRMVEVKLAKLPASAPSELKRVTDRGVDLANAGLWKDAGGLVDQIKTLGASNQEALWDAALIRLHAAGRAEQVKLKPYPILDNVFYGDYPAAVDVMRRYSAAQIFDRRTPLVVSTVAEGAEEQLANASIDAATRAIAVKPDLAAAYFIRGWARNLDALRQNRPVSQEALADVSKAAELAPSDRLFSESAALLTRGR
ncbi:MAG: hypothetical protein HY675_25220 [Chloroflexi bacterium]|nr:hypothetical protein [Chloroflexota bacterium]